MKQALNRLCAWLEKNYGFSALCRIHADLSPGLPNIFLKGRDAQGRVLFIKSGTTPGLYYNEYKWSEHFYRLAPDRVAQPLYYRDAKGIRFFACEYLEGQTLDKYMGESSPSPGDKQNLLEDLWEIFLAFQASDMVHRDIRPQNLLVCQGRLMVVDFQLAVSYSQYEEPDCFRRARWLLADVGENFAYGCLHWDDTWSLLQVANYIGREEEYAARFDEMTAAMTAAVGRRSIRYGYRHKHWWKRLFWMSKLLSLVHPVPSSRRTFRCRKIAARHVLKRL